MENKFKLALTTVVNFFENEEIRYAVIGGIANQVWGQARFTYDIDIKVLVPNLEYDILRNKLISAFPEPGRPDLPLNPFIVSVKIEEIIIDFLLSTPGYEEQLVDRAIRYEIEGMSLRICTAEDLIIQKAIAGRTKDWQDIEGIMIEQNISLDQNYLENWLHQFADVLEKPEIFAQYQRIYERVII